MSTNSLPRRRIYVYATTLQSSRAYTPIHKMGTYSDKTMVPRGAYAGMTLPNMAALVDRLPTDAQFDKDSNIVRWFNLTYHDLELAKFKIRRYITHEQFRNDKNEVVPLAAGDTQTIWRDQGLAGVIPLFDNEPNQLCFMANTTGKDKTALQSTARDFRRQCDIPWLQDVPVGGDTARLVPNIHNSFTHVPPEPAQVADPSNEMRERACWRLFRKVLIQTRDGGNDQYPSDPNKEIGAWRTRNIKLGADHSPPAPQGPQVNRKRKRGAAEQIANIEARQAAAAKPIDFVNRVVVVSHAESGDRTRTAAQLGEIRIPIAVWVEELRATGATGVFDESQLDFEKLLNIMKDCHMIADVDNLAGVLVYGWTNDNDAALLAAVESSGDLVNAMKIWVDSDPTGQVGLQLTFESLGIRDSLDEFP